MLLVADREDRPSDQARAGASEKFGGEAGDDFPLLRARILRLVDQHVVDPLIELVVHPGRALRAEQRQRLVDEIVVIKLPAPILHRLVTGEHGIGDGDERRRAVAAGHGFAALDEPKHPLALAAEALGKLGVGELRRSGEDLLARLELTGDKDLLIKAGALRGARRRRGKEPPRLLVVALAAPLKGLGGGRPLRCWKDGAIRHLAFDPLDRIVPADAERAAKCGDGRLDAAAVVDPGAHRIALADCLADHVLERLVGCPRNGARQRAAERLFWRQGCVEQHAEANLVEELRLRRLVENAEAGGDIGLERKMMQQSRTEGVNGLHLQSARRLQCHGEQPPCERAPRRVRLDARNLLNGCVELDIVERGPAAQLVKDAVRHVCGGGLGKRDAEDLCRVDAVEQQTDHAQRENMGLAGSGIGRHPRRGRGIRCLDLQAPQVAGNDAANSLRRAHHSLSASSGPATDHSFTRARWSYVP